MYRIEEFVLLGYVITALPYIELASYITRLPRATLYMLLLAQMKMTLKCKI